MDVITRVMEAGCICDLKISYYIGQVKLQPSDLGLLDQDLPEELYALGKRRLIPRERVNLFKRVESRARRVLSDNSWAFPATSCGRFVSAHLIDEVNQKLYDEKVSFIDEMQAFFGEYQAVRQQMMTEWQEHLVKLAEKEGLDFDISAALRHLEGLYPTSDGLARRFQFRWDWYSLAFPSGESFSWSDQRAEIRKEAMLKYRAYAERSVANFLEGVAADLRAEVTRTVEIFAGLVAEKQDPAEIHHKQLQSVRDFLDRFERMNFLGDRSVAKALDRLRATLPENVADLNDFHHGAGTLRQRIRAALGKAHDAAVDVVSIPKVVGSFLEYGRTIDE